MSALPPLRATQLRVALALVLLEHTPDSMSLSDWLASLRERVRSTGEPRAAPVERQKSRAQACAPQLDIPVPHRSRVRPEFGPDASSQSPVAPIATRPSRAASTAPTTAHDASPAGLLRDIAAVTDERDDASGVESSQDIDELARSWALLDQVALAAGRLPVVEDEPGPSRAPEELESGMRTRGRVRKASDKATRADVERELFAAVEGLLARTLSTPATEEPAAALALAVPLLVHLSTSFPRRTLSLLAPTLLGAVHALLFDLLCGLAVPQLTAAAHARALLARLAPTLSLAHLSLPAAPTLPPAPTNSPSYDTLEHAIDGLVRLVAGTGVDAQLAVVQLPGEEGLSVEGAVLGLLERAWAVRDTLCMADEADEAA